MYKLNEPVYGLVRKVIDALGRVDGVSVLCSR